MNDVFKPDAVLDTVQVRVERTLKFVSRELMTADKALGGQTLEQAGIDPDTPLPKAAAMMIKGWANSRDGILGYLSQWSLLEKEVQVINHIKVYVNGELVHETEI